MKYETTLEGERERGCQLPSEEEEGGGKEEERKKKVSSSCCAMVGNMLSFF